MKRNFTKLAILFLCMRMSVSCGSIIHGTSQDVNVRSNPDEAEVWVDGARIGKTPTRLTLKRKEAHFIKFVKDGYKDTEVKISNEVSGWLFGNIIFGGLIGCGVDLISGGAYNLKPDTLDINLDKAVAYNGGTINILQSDLDQIKQINFTDNHGSVISSVSLKWKD